VNTGTNVSARSEIAIELRGITKAFGSVVANNNIDLTIRRGEILALLGENGSGKTTLMNMLSGIYHPDSGQIFVNGNEVFIKSPEDSARLGIGMIHQHFKLVDVLTAADNIVLGTPGSGMLLTRQRFEAAKKVGERYGMAIDPEKKIYEMSVSEKQTVEILKVLYRGADILILDEPTAVLTPQETKRLFDILRRMRSSGCAIVIITHKLNEVLEISDRVTILRRGESVATVKTSETDAAKLTEYMVGRPVELKINRPEVPRTETLLHVYHLTVEDEEGVTRLDDVTFNLHGGEILGVAGVAGSGQKELCETIAGLQPLKKGAILYKKENIEGKSPREIIKLGISMSFIPEDRLGMGLAASLDIADNMMLKNYRDPRSPFTDRKSAENMARQVIDKLGVVTSGVNQPVRMLSGGNVQKVLLGREIHVNPSVLITAYPVRGLDIGSSYVIYDALNEQKKRGVGVLFIGEDLDVMLELCDRIMVLCHGRITGIVNARTATKEQLGLLMAGTKTSERYGEEVVDDE
jgi:ABC-type uncharacterized transport system ATPase subunit